MFFVILYLINFVISAVKSIKKQHLVEVRSMANPPQAVKVALESICLLLGEQANDWRAIRGIIIRDNFISTIVNFQTENIRYVSRYKASC
jgi:dynein heavy chain 1